MAIHPKLSPVVDSPGVPVQRVIIPKLGPNRFQPADYQFHRYAAKVPSGTTLKDIFHPDYFQNYLSEMRPDMEIKIKSEDRKLNVLLEVVSVGRATVTLEVLHIYKGGEIEEAAQQSINPADIDVSWGGPSQKWRVVYNGTILAKDYDSKEVAEAFRDRYVAGLEK